MSVRNRIETHEELKQIVAAEVDKGPAKEYGRELFYRYFRNQGHIVSRYIRIKDDRLLFHILIYEMFRDRLFAVARSVNLESIKLRTRDMQRHKGEYIVQGPNQIDRWMDISYWNLMASKYMEELMLILVRQNKQSLVLIYDMMKTSARVRRQEHPDTLTNISNLASTYGIKGGGRRPRSWRCKWWKGMRGCRAGTFRHVEHHDQSILRYVEVSRLQSWGYFTIEG